MCLWCLEPEGGLNAGIPEGGKPVSAMLLSDLANPEVFSANGMQLQLVQALSVSACLRCLMTGHDGILLRGTRQDLQTESITDFRMEFLSSFIRLLASPGSHV